MLDNDHKPTPMEKNDSPKNNPLIELKDKMKSCYDRAFQPVAGKLPEPTPEDVPFDLDKYATALAILDVEDFLPDSLKKSMLDSIDKASPKDLSNKYRSGSKYCLAIMPLVSPGGITGKFYCLQVDAKGLTYNYTSDPAYYFLNFPKEVQEQCSFKAPTYESPLGPSDAERAELKKLFEEKWNNLKQLIAQKKKAA